MDDVDTWLFEMVDCAEMSEESLDVFCRFAAAVARSRAQQVSSTAVRSTDMQVGVNNNNNNNSYPAPMHK